MKDKIKLLMFVIGCITLIILGILFWPTIYFYDKMGGEFQFPVRINRITGYTEKLTGTGWHQVDGWQKLKAISFEEIKHIEISSKFNIRDYGERADILEADIYNGTNWTIKKMRLSIEGKNKRGKTEWRKIYETSVKILPFSKGFFSMNLIDSIFENPFADLLERERSEKTNQKPNASISQPPGTFFKPLVKLSPFVEIKELFGCKEE
jgi:hypothetical protein